MNNIDAWRRGPQRLRLVAVVCDCCHRVSFTHLPPMREGVVNVESVPGGFKTNEDSAKGIPVTDFPTARLTLPAEEETVMVQVR